MNNRIPLSREPKWWGVRPAGIRTCRTGVNSAIRPAQDGIIHIAQEPEDTNTLLASGEANPSSNFMHLYEKMPK